MATTLSSIFSFTTPAAPPPPPPPPIDPPVYSPVGGMTLAEMVTYVCDRLVISTSDLSRVTQIRGMLVRAHRRLVVSHSLIQKRADLVFIAGSPDVVLPSDWARTRTIERGDMTMSLVSWRDLADMTGAADGPVVYAMKGAGAIIVYPTPTESTYTGAVLWYDAFPTSMAADSDIPEGVPLGYHEIIPELVIHRVALAEEELGLAAAAKTVADELTLDMRTLLNRRGGSIPTQIPIRRSGGY